MEEAEVPLEQVQENVEHVHHSHEHGPSMKSDWVSWAALMSAVLAVLAAVSALYSGAKANEAMMSQIRASDQWNYYQAKGIKASVLETRQALSLKKDEKLQSKIEKYADEQAEIQNKAQEFEKESAENFEEHEIFAHAVTFFQIAIAVTAISVLVKRRRFLFVSLAFGAVATFYLIRGFLLLGSVGHH